MKCFFGEAAKGVTAEIGVRYAKMVKNESNFKIKKLMQKYAKFTEILYYPKFFGPKKNSQFYSFIILFLYSFVLFFLLA